MEASRVNENKSTWLAMLRVSKFTAPSKGSKKERPARLGKPSVVVPEGIPNLVTHF